MIIAEKTCKIEGCDNKHKGNGLCQKHYAREYYREYNKTQLSHIEERNAYASMKQRCTNTKNKTYTLYGGRGIKVCDRWLSGENDKSGFTCFLEDMGKKPHASYSLDRIDSNGNYEPSNCRWADANTQAVNRRLPKNNTSGYRGVYYRKERGKWTASIRNKQVFKKLGSFDSAKEASLAYEEAAMKYRGYVIKY